MKANFRHALTQLLEHEGGFVNDPRDRGGATNLGVTIGTLSSVLGRPATVAEVRALTPRTVEPVYRKLYWDKVAGDLLPSGLDLHVFDFGVNAGNSRAAKMLQSIIGVAADGVIGPKTLGVLSQAIAKDGALVKAIRAYGLQRELYYRGLAQFPIYGRGWLARNKAVTEEAVRMAQGTAIRAG